MTKLQISDQILAAFPHVVLGVVTFYGIDNSGNDDEIMTGLRNEQTRVAQLFEGKPISEHPHISPWRDAYRKFGAKPKEYPSSIENLLRRVIKGYRLPHINSVVDLYNTISLRYILPVGGEDLDKIEGNVRLDFASEDEPRVRLLGETEERPPRPGEVIYKDDAGAICRRWNWKEADRTKFTDKTTNGFLVIERLPPVSITIIQQAINELVFLITRYCRGSVKNGMIDADHPGLDLS